METLKLTGKMRVIETNNTKVISFKVTCFEEDGSVFLQCNACGKHIAAMGNPNDYECPNCGNSGSISY